MKQNNSKHTQGIYEVGIAEQTYGTTFIEVREGTIEINSSEGALIALCGNERNAEAQANAERICTAVNGYDALLKSNEELLEALKWSFEKIGKPSLVKGQNDEHFNKWNEVNNLITTNEKVS